MATEQDPNDRCPGPPYFPVCEMCGRAGTELTQDQIHPANTVFIIYYPSVYFEKCGVQQLQDLPEVPILLSQSLLAECQLLVLLPEGAEGTTQSGVLAVREPAVGRHGQQSAQCLLSPIMFWGQQQLGHQAAPALLGQQGQQGHLVILTESLLVGGVRDGAQAGLRDQLLQEETDFPSHLEFQLSYVTQLHFQTPLCPSMFSMMQMSGILAHARP